MIDCSVHSRLSTCSRWINEAAIGRSGWGQAALRFVCIRAQKDGWAQCTRGKKTCLSIIYIDCHCSVNGTHDLLSSLAKNLAPNVNDPNYREKKISTPVFTNICQGLCHEINMIKKKLFKNHTNEYQYFLLMSP